jgi:hypothetical protein
VAEYTDVQHIQFTGTSPFDLELSSGTATVWNDYNLPSDVTLVSFTDATGAPGRIAPFPYTLDVSAAIFCAGETGVTFALSGTQKGVSYQLYKDGAATGEPLSGTGSSAAFSGSFNEGGVYTARSVAAGVYLETKMDGTRTVTKQALPATPAITASAGTVCQSTDVVFKVSSPVAGATYTWSGNPAGVESGTGKATYTVNSVTDVVSASVYSRVTLNGITCQSANAATLTVSVIPVAPPTVASATFCYGFPGQLVAAATGANIAWYDASTGGTKLGDGNVLQLTPLYNASALYYAEAITVNNCISDRTQAVYTVNNCIIGACPSYTAGGVDSNATPAACAAHYTGKIGVTDYPPACVAHDSGRIGRAQ